MKAIDLYSGIGGWTLGLELAGIEVVRCYEWWDRALGTYNTNLPSVAKQQDIRALSPRDIDVDRVDVIVGSPPCTQFSYANRGGSGDIADGLKDIAKFLEIVAHFRPKYWAMENVPRVANVLERELAAGGQLEDFNGLVSVIEVLDVSEFGVPQRRRRMIAGDFPVDILRSYKAVTPRITLGDVLSQLHSKRPTDPIYDLSISRDQLTEMEIEEHLDTEEKRMNYEAKRFHPVYNKMPFPDQTDRPSRTVTALCTRVSRESIVIEDPAYPKKLRRLNVRERACLQGFPINYQIMGRSYPEKLKLVGNAIPPPLTYLIGQAMSQTTADTLPPLARVTPKTSCDPAEVRRTPPTGRGTKYPANRSFRAAIPNLRFGSGMRFDLSNKARESWVAWEIGFCFGPSKQVRRVDLDSHLYRALRAEDFFEQLSQTIGNGSDRMMELLRDATPISIQRTWSRRADGIGPYDIVDELGRWAEELIDALHEVPEEQVETFVLEACGYKDTTERKNGIRKLAQNAMPVTAGMIIGVWFNSESPLSSSAPVASEVFVGDSA
ncbi:DNA cytosine methyltransferase [Lentisalinibacter salinarum]|uniref:DNA cytosine methyltransferase n=1 Tax=Lentisalinibacter salinarum TaxID=2992239 RepID=UPI00386B0D3C